MRFKTNKIWKSACAVVITAACANLFSSCNDDLPAESYYTFTGEMMSDFLRNHEDFSLFCQIVERAGQMDFLGSRGGRTFFPAINSGVEEYMREHGYASVDEIPVEVCDTLVKACLLDNNIRYTYDFAETVQENNELELPLIIVTDGDSVDANGMAVSIINRNAAIINDLKNDSVDNGVVHPVDKVVVPNMSMGSALLDDNHGEYSIYYEALSRTGLLDSLIHYRDDSYETWKNNYPEWERDLRSGGIFNENDAGYLYIAKRPDHRYEGFTVFVVPDQVLYEKYPTYFNEGMTMDEKIDGLYDLAREKYGDDMSEQIFGLDLVNPDDPEGRTYKECFWNRESLTSRHNPLNMFLSYHILDRLFASTAKLINCWGTNTNYADPTEWISTLLDYSTIKLERVYATIDPQVEYPNGYYINHTAGTRYNGGERVRGAYLTTPDAMNFSLNVAYYYLDDVVAYDNVMRDNIMNNRLRFDFVTLWPELTNNNIRLCGNPTQVYSEGVDASENGGEADGFNYYIPPGYMENTSFSENTIFFVQRPKVPWWNWGGDEINILGSSYDVTFQLPHVPPGTYELRLGYPGMLDRGIAQVYVDGRPQGIPMDLRYQADDSRVGGLYNDTQVRNSDESNNGSWDSETLEENERIMNNNGYYSGPKACFTGNDGTDAPRFSPTNCTTMYNNRYTFRRKVCDVVIEPHTTHTIRFRSVFTQGNKGCFVLDYFELVPISICGAGGLGEDLY